jgi:hypothetical protein
MDKGLVIRHRSMMDIPRAASRELNGNLCTLLELRRLGSSWNIRGTCVIVPLNLACGSLEAYGGVTHNLPKP